MSEQREDPGIDEILARLPRAAAPVELRARLARLRPRRRWWPTVAAAGAAAALTLVAVLVVNPRALSHKDELVAEAVADHLRVVSSSRPVEIESGGQHEVRPWFSGRVDFAPRLDFDGDGDFALVGGSVGWFLDRKAAVIVWRRRLHTVSLVEVRANGLDWPAERAARANGFSVLLWRDGDLGMALVSDAAPAELSALRQKLAAPRQ